MKQRNPTISDIAKIANVSIATVSRVLSKADYPVKYETREKILKIAKEIDYKPNIFSKMLKGCPSKEIGVIIPSITNPFYAQLVSAVEGVCIKRGYIPIICSSYNSRQLEEKYIEMLSQRHVAGMIMSTISNSPKFIKKLSNTDMKFVFFDQNYEGLECDSVSFNFQKGGYLATEYLINCGHKDIALLTAPIDRKSRRMVVKGYKQALEDKGFKLNRQRIVISDTLIKDDGAEFEYENGRALTQLLLQSDVLPDAIMAINDMTAIGIMKELGLRGINVPNDISLIGFDNISISEMVTPALTTINQPSYETGTLAANMLLDRIEGKKIMSNKMIMQPILIERSSVKKHTKNKEDQK